MEQQQRDGGTASVAADPVVASPAPVAPAAPRRGQGAARQPQPPAPR